MAEPSQPRRKLMVDLAELAAALDYSSDSISNYLDLETGKLAMVTEEDRICLSDIYQRFELDGGQDDSEFHRKFYLALEALHLADWQKQAVQEAHHVESGYGTRYEPVPRSGSRQGYRDMEDFIDTVASQRLAELLSVAINDRGAFRRFKDVLARYPAEREVCFRQANLAVNSSFQDVIGITVFSGNLPSPSELTTTAGRVLVISAPLAGSKLTRHTSPRRN